MAKRLPILLPKPTASESKVTDFFSAVSTKAIKDGFTVSGVSMRWLIIEGQMKIIPYVGPRKECVRLLIDHEENFKFQVLDVTLDSGKLTEAILQKYLDQMKPDSDYDMCPGVETVYQGLKHKIQTAPTTLRVWPKGIRYDHTECELWYNPTLVPKKSPSYICQKCSILIKTLKTTVKRTTAANLRGILPKSYPLKYMTPETRRRLLQEKTTKISQLTKKLQKYENHVCNRNDKQNKD